MKSAVPANSNSHWISALKSPLLAMVPGELDKYVSEPKEQAASKYCTSYRKKLISSQYNGCLIGILVLAYCISYLYDIGYCNLLHNRTNQFYHCSYMYTRKPIMKSLKYQIMTIMAIQSQCNMRQQSSISNHFGLKMLKVKPTSCKTTKVKVYFSQDTPRNFETAKFYTKALFRLVSHANQ